MVINTKMLSNVRKTEQRNDYLIGFKNPITQNKNEKTVLCLSKGMNLIVSFILNYEN